MASHFESWNDLRPKLQDALPFNSAQTRRRYVSSLFRWALDGGDFRAIGVQAWSFYRDCELVEDILKDRYLHAYPVLGRFVATCLASMPSGGELDVHTIERHLVDEQVGALDRSVGKLRSSMRDLGFIRKIGERYVIIETSLPKTAFLILLHYYMAPKPTTVAVPEIVKQPFWLYLGGRHVNEVRSALSHAAAGDVISRYVTVDGLEQITTRFSLQELLERQVRLDS